MASKAIRQGAIGEATGGASFKIGDFDFLTLRNLSLGISLAGLLFQAGFVEFLVLPVGELEIGAIMTNRFWIAIAWVGYFAIVLVSLVPGSARPHIHGFPAELEHFVAYGAAGSAYGLAYCSTFTRIVSGLILSAASALFEGLQSFVPDRTPELADILASTVGAWIGLGFAVLATIVISHPATQMARSKKGCREVDPMIGVSAASVTLGSSPTAASGRSSAEARSADVREPNFTAGISLAKPECRANAETLLRIRSVAAIRAPETCNSCSAYSIGDKVASTFAQS